MAQLAGSAPSLRSQLLRRKATVDPADDGGPRLRRSLGTFQLAMIGVGCTVGTGIFFSLSTAVPKAGPAVVVSFLVACLTAGLAALCYAELASNMPVSGSTYSYAYASLGELVAMGIAACLTLEYGVSAAASAVGWSGYVNQLFVDLLGVNLPYWALHPPGVSDGASAGVVNIPAAVLVFLCAVLLVRGVSESMTVNTIMVIIKLSVLAFFGAVALTAFNSNNFADFAPMGSAGVVAGSASIFFTFVGIDAVSTAGEEVRDPKRTLPRAILLALGVVLFIYMLVAVAAVGTQPWTAFEGQEAGLAVILQNVTGQTWPGVLVAAGAVISIFSVVLVAMYGQTRILYAMGRDGMISKRFAKVSGTTRTPVFNTVVVSLLVALAAAFTPLDALADVTSIGTIVAFIVVAISIVVLRRRAGTAPSGFRVPGYPVTPVLTVVVCCYVLSGLGWVTWAVFGVWIVATLVYYLRWGRHGSVLN
ncbi:APC family permease [Pseudonocardia acaciae]|uniref:APC family permease n=1 Tax=Pseudonocardia acaciae TaxID=551276 RepID=UPI000ACD84D9|nr:amino acid permease [Pseudonocardia acaciae]